MKIKFIIVFLFSLASCDFFSPEEQKIDYKIIWKHKLDPGFTFAHSITYHDNVIYYHRENKIVAISSEDGSMIWQTAADLIFYDTDEFKFYQNKIYININKKLYCLNKETGNIIWEIEVSSSTTNTSFIKNGMYYVGNKYKSLVIGINLETGIIEDEINFIDFLSDEDQGSDKINLLSVSYNEKYDLLLVGGLTPAKEGIWLAGTYFFFYDFTNKNLKKRVYRQVNQSTQTPGISSKPFIYNDFIAIGDQDGFLEIYNLKSFDLIHRINTENFFFYRSFVGFENHVIAYGNQLYFESYDMLTGKKDWLISNYESFYGIAKVQDGIFYGVSAALFAVDIKSGKVLWESFPEEVDGGKFVGKAEYGDGKVFVSTNKTIYAVEAIKTSD